MLGLQNPSGAFKSVSDFTNPVTPNGELVTPEFVTADYRANAAVAKGDALMWVAPTTTVPLSVTPMTSAGADYLFAGVATEAAAAGEYLRVGIQGHFQINVGSTTPAAGNYVIVPDATTGVFGTDATPDDTDTLVGINWGAKDSNNLAFAYINRNGIVIPFEAGP